MKPTANSKQQTTKNNYNYYNNTCTHTDTPSPPPQGTNQTIVVSTFTTEIAEFMNLVATIRVIGVNMWMWVEWLVNHSPVNLDSE